MTWGCDSNNLIRWTPPGGGTKIPVPSCVPKQDGSGPFRDSPVRWVPTIMDRLDGAGLTWRIYSTYNWWSVCPSFADCVFDPQVNNALPAQQVLADGKKGGLASLSLVIPGWANSQHNGTPIASGDNWIASIVNAVAEGPDWDSTAIFITYDDCGCFYDHVRPPAGLGIRVPMVIVSPYAKAGFVDSSVASYDSMMAYTEHAFDVRPLASSDAAAYDFAWSFDYSQAPLDPVPLRRHRVPAAALRWMREHPHAPDPT
jgi:phospholipase C